MVHSIPHDPVTLLRHALDAGDHGLADALLRSFRNDPGLARRADAALAHRERGPSAGPSPLGRRLVAELAAYLRSGVRP